MSNLIVKMKFGSHVYGTNVPTSDLDLKAIYLPSAKDILLQRARQVQHDNSKEDERAKNGPDDVDYEVFSLQRYLELLMQGQTVALDMLFTPDEFIIEKSPLWDLLRNMRGRFLHCGVSSFAGYCRTQANKYGIKGSRMRAVKDIIKFFDTFPPSEKLHVYWDAILEYIANNHSEDTLVQITPVFHKSKNENVDYLDICGRKFEDTVNTKYVTDALQKIYDNYGERARKAENNEGIDWKALMHAVRVQEEAKELLSTGFITFPRPERDLLLQIRKGELPYKEVALLIEGGLIELEHIQQTSLLPEKPDQNTAENIIVRTYAKIVKEAKYA